MANRISFTAVCMIRSCESSYRRRRRNAHTFFLWRSYPISRIYLFHASLYSPLIQCTVKSCFFFDSCITSEIRCLHILSFLVPRINTLQIFLYHNIQAIYSNFPTFIKLYIHLNKTYCNQFFILRVTDKLRILGEVVIEWHSFMDND